MRIQSTLTIAFLSSLFLAACNTDTKKTEQKTTSDSTKSVTPGATKTKDSSTSTAMPESGFTNKAEAKNQLVNGLQEGKWIEYFDSLKWKPTKDSNNASNYILAIYKHGKRDGLVRWYYMNNMLFHETTYKDGKADGMSKAYFKTGKVRAEYPFTQDKENGLEKQYYPTGIIRRETPYTNDHIDGIVKDYYEDGKLQSETPCVHDTVEGIRKEYAEAGNVTREASFRSGRENGTWKEYYDNGTLKQLSIFLNGQKVDEKNYTEAGAEITDPKKEHHKIPHKEAK
jgi:antitoxin component YwqK of YwqJK toxin-antitoxin module